MNEELRIDLGDLETEDIEVFLLEASRGLPDFAASSGTFCPPPGSPCSCTVQEAPEQLLKAR